MEKEEIVLAVCVSGSVGFFIGSLITTTVFRNRLKKLTPLIESTMINIIRVALERGLTVDETVEMINKELAFFQIAIKET